MAVSILVHSASSCLKTGNGTKLLVGASLKRSTNQDLGATKLVTLDMSVTIEVGKPCLPQDIIEEILSRLPAKSVGRFRCVSKSWHHLTTQPDFIDSHLKRQRQKLIFSSISSFFSLDYEGQDVVPLELDFPLNYPHNQGPVDMFGSCNGLVCIMPQPLTFVIFNPCAGESLRIPHFPVSSLPCDSCIYYFNAHSFGYAPSIKDYKFVTIYEQIVFVFSLKTKTWKRVQDLPYMYLKRDPGTHLNGAIHWLCQDPGGHPVIAALDLAEDKFSILPPPESVRDDRENKTGVLRGCLCLLQRNEGNWPCSFWVMEEYGVKESWKRFLIGTARRTTLSSRPLCYWKNTKVLLLRNQLEILLGNPKNGSCKGFLDYGSLRMVFDSDLYVESLVSPNFPKKKCSCNHVKPKFQHCTRFSSTASASLLNYCNKLG